jgi:uncharacterized membrane protein YhaH (DUF805 family)
MVADPTGGIMGFADAIRSALQNALNFRDRASRPEFWWWMLLAFAVNVVLSETDSWSAGLVSFAIALPTIAVGVRRLHDTDRSGWFYLLTIIPLVNLVLLYFFVQAGTPGSNRFGPPPPSSSPGYRSGPASGSDPGPGWNSPPPPPPPLA